MTADRQFALPFPDTQFYAAADFLPGACNERALAWLASPGAWPALRLVVHGAAGTGKTHLLHVFAARAGATLLPAHVLPRLAAPPAAPLAIDDADAAPDELALLHALNTASEHRQPVLMAARVPPAAWAVALPDLASRLRASCVVGLGLPEDDLLAPLLARALAHRQLRVPEALQNWLLQRLPRTGGALREAAARLDRLSLGGPINRALAARVVSELTGAREEEAEPPGATLSLLG